MLFLSWYIKGPAGEKTANLFDVSDFTYIEGSGSLNKGLWIGSLPTGTYTVSLNQDNTLTSSVRNTLSVTINGTTSYETAEENYHNNAGLHFKSFSVTDTDSIEIRYWAHTLSNNCTFSNAMLNTGSSPLPYEPFGYKIPILCNTTTSNIYIEEALGENDILHSTETDYTIATEIGENILRIQGETQPSRMQIVYKWEFEV